jgi:hypothetical protein
MATNNKRDLNEFKSVDGQSELPGTAVSGSASRAADKTTGETDYSATTKAEVMSKIMGDLMAKDMKDVMDVYHAITSNSNSNRRMADKSTSGETYATTTHSPTAVSGINPDAVTVKPVVAREDVSEIFAGSELSEELLSRASTVYEAAVNSRLAIIETRLQEQYAETLSEAIDLMHDEMLESLDKYVTYVASQWMEENQLAVDNGLKAEMAEEFILGLKDIFEANYVTVSPDRSDIVTSMAEEIDHLNSRLNEAVEDNIKLTEELNNAKIADLVAEHAASLTVSQREKFASLIENIVYEDVNDLTRKIENIKETYFSDNISHRNASAEPLTEGYEIEEEQEIPSNMKAYSEAISRTLKK